MSGRTPPSFGEFTSATTITSTYKSAIGTYRTAFQQLQILVQDIVDTSATIAKNYKSAESLANAKVGDVDKALADAMKDDQPAGTPGPRSI